KHFAVVTVAAKIMIPLIPLLKPLLEAPLLPLGHMAAWGFTWTTLLFLPGLAGFVVWELKENWRLYEANRPKTLRPVVIGHHGETMARLLKPGFHSGTVPKLFARLRKAERTAIRTGHAKRVRGHMVHLEGVEESVRHFIDRDFLALLLQSRSMAGTPIALGEILPGAKRFLVELIRPGRVGPALWLSFEEYSGWLVAGIVDPGWVDDLPPAERDA